MTDARALLAQPEHELEILHSVVGRIESSPDGELSFHTKQVTDVHHPAKIFRRPIRLEKRFDEIPGAIVELILIGINDVVSFVDFVAHRFKSQGMQEIVVIEKADKLSARDFK